MGHTAVVTGTGALTPLGGSAEETWSALVAGDRGVGPITRFDPAQAGLSVRIAGEVDVDPAAHPAVDESRMGRYAQLGVAASRAALASAGLEPGGPHWDPDRVGVSIGTGYGGLAGIEAGVGDRVRPTLPVRSLASLGAGYVSQSVDARGPIRSPATACAAGTHAIGAAVRDVRAGRADVVLAGGCESAVTPVGVGGFEAMRALSTGTDDPGAASRPFDADRDGFVVSEGAAVLVVESGAHARERGVDGTAEITGFARTADAHHPTAPPPDAHGLARSISLALEDAGRSPAAVDHVNAHATGTPRGDAHEARAIRAVFDPVPPVTSVKGATGHALGASGAIEAAVAVRSLAEGVRPPTANYRTPDPDCAVPVVDRTESAPVDVVVSTSSGFGGANGTLVLEVADDG